jgi:molybdopterin adenylyltransferase
LTVGGAGFPAGEIVPEVCHPLIKRPVPGIPEAIREAGLAVTPLASLFRGTAGVTADGRLLVNLPDDGPWLEASLTLLAGLLGHALDKAAGDPRDCGRVG